MKLFSRSFSDGGMIPGEFAFCVIDKKAHVALASNRNPQLEWCGFPKGTRSFVLICIDGDVPSRADDVNQEDKVVASDLPRIDFFHWVMVDLPSTLTAIEAGQCSDGVIAGGRLDSPIDTAFVGGRQGLNDYTGWFNSDPTMRGNYHGYDGPCPPWNDTLMHRYVFTIYALDIAKLQVYGTFTGQQVLEAMRDHILDKATLNGRYTLNPALADLS